MTALNPVDAAQAVQYAQLELACEDSFTEAGDRYVPDVPADPRIMADHTIRAIITGQDVIFHVGPLKLDTREVFYGWLLERAAKPGQFLLLIRGTATLDEWWDDAQFIPQSYPAGGTVESGFYGIYQTLKARLPGQAAAGATLPLISTISALVGSGTVTVVGHSLGSALATYLAVDLAGTVGDRVRMRLFASPRPGDETFARYAARRVRDAVGYVNPLDVVPQVPEGFGYCELPSRVMLPIQGALPMPRNAGQMHHLTTYLYLLDPTFDFSVLPPVDAPYLTWWKPAKAA